MSNLQEAHAEPVMEDLREKAPRDHHLQAHKGILHSDRFQPSPLSYASEYPVESAALAHPQMEETLHLYAIDGLAIREILLDRAILRLCVLDGGLHGSRKVLG
jgi:hypothetical protein